MLNIFPRIAILRFVSFLLLACLTFSVYAQKSGDDPSSRGKTYAVVIGISSYENKAIPPLQFADKDATLFAAFLQSPAGGSLPDSQMKVLINSEATQAAVYSAVNWLKKVCKKNDVTYLYFSGHGDLETTRTKKEGYLLTYNSPPHNYTNNALDVDWLNEVARSLSVQKNAKVVFVTDACHSGKLAGEFYKGKQLVGKALRRVLENQVRLTSCAENEVALEGSDWGGGRGIFSYYLLQGLNGYADHDKSGIVQLESLKNFLTQSLQNDPVLKERKLTQTPVVNGHPAFVLATINDQSFDRYKAVAEKMISAKATYGTGLAAFKPAAVQPIDEFFSIMDTLPIESFVGFTNFMEFQPFNFPAAFVSSCIVEQRDKFQSWGSIVEFMKQHGKLSGTPEESGPGWPAAEHQPWLPVNMLSDSIALTRLQNQLSKPSFAQEFNRRFVQCAQNKAQRLINAYLEGDIAELEKRQYYSTGRKGYKDLLMMLELALKIVENDNPLAHILLVDKLYLTGLVARLELVTSGGRSDLLQSALSNQKEALQLEPDAAYIHNELGNLYLYNNDLPAAASHFKQATDWAPTWAIPWGNLIRLYTATKNWKAADSAAREAALRQPDISFVAMNRGFAMEQAQNWLDAETNYRQAIRGNNIHFFPYDRLANVYLKTGRFADADHYFFEAEERKKGYVLDKLSFKYGVATSVQPVQKKYKECMAYIRKSTGRHRLFADLLEVLRQYNDSTIMDEVLVERLQDILSQVPAIPLAHHYLGKKLFQLGKWAEAEAVLLKAVRLDNSEAALRARLKGMLYGNTKPADTCLLWQLMEQKYNQLEDHYLLGALYERRNAEKEAIEQYRIIAAVENKRQMEEAKLTGLRKLLDAIDRNEVKQEDVAYEIQQAMTHGVRTIEMGGTIKLARIYIKQGAWALAEKVLLDQVGRNKAATWARWQVDNKHQRDYGFGNDPVDYYLQVNQAVDLETSRFYTQVTNAFPRDGHWMERAGLFLYKRLKISYKRFSPDEYKDFTKEIDRYDYSWLSYRQKDTVKRFIILPVTGEELSFEKLDFHPVRQTGDYLLGAIELSGDPTPKRELRLALADVYQWLDKPDSAIGLMKAALQQQPADFHLRSKLVKVLVNIGNLTEANEHLQVINQKNQLERRQLLQAAEFSILSRNFPFATSLLNRYKPQNEQERFAKMQQLVIMHWLDGKPALALKYVQDSLPNITISVPVQFSSGKPEEKEADKKFFFRMYFMAKLYAVLKQNDKALAVLEKALKKGFYYQRVLNNDPVWSALQTTKQWQEMMTRYQSSLNRGSEIYLNVDNFTLLSKYFTPFD